MTNLQATKLEERINKLADGFTGQILLPGNDAYESARRIWNAMIDRRPALIARCATASDVVARRDLRARDRPAAGGARRRAQHRRQRDLRRTAS